MYVNSQDYNLDDKIYRIAPFEHILDMIINNRITLVKTILWDDPLENILWKQKYYTLQGEFGFTCLPGGLYSDYNDAFYEIGINAYFWSSTNSNSDVWIRILRYNTAEVTEVESNMPSSGTSVRCIKD